VRGTRLVVVGDPKQLPPTNFFSVMSGQEAATLAEDGTPQFEDSESVLEEFLAAGVPKTRLRWHYRSRHESLIAFSNVSFYDADLFTFPSVETGGLSVTYARARDGKLRYILGPINGENGWRRLNVLTTRARQRMVVFSSIRGDDISPSAVSSRGPQLLREFLLYAERGILQSESASRAADVESPFEREVLAELTARGLRLQPQVGIAGYRIDFGVLDDEVPGRYVCGIECDGAAYHASETARDRDPLRQQVLEARGWELHRVWSTDWFKDREGQIERLLHRVEESRQRVREVATERAAQAAAARGDAEAETAGGPTASAESRSREPAGASARPLVGSTPGALPRTDRPSRAPGTSLPPSFAALPRRNGWIPAERIPPDEYREAALRVMRALGGGGLPRKEVINRIRGVLGFRRTGPRLEAAIGAALDALLAEGILGEGSTGLRLRE
jgi:very-short-patch-repair endonuclease